MWLLFQSATKTNTKSRTAEVKLGLYTCIGPAASRVQRPPCATQGATRPQVLLGPGREEWSVSNELQTSGWGTHRHEGGTEGGPMWTYKHKWTVAQSGQKQQWEWHRSPDNLARGLGSPSWRVLWTSCPMTWLFGVETGDKHLREELWGLHWQSPVAESSHPSV